MAEMLNNESEQIVCKWDRRLLGYVGSAEVSDTCFQFLSTSCMLIHALHCSASTLRVCLFAGYAAEKERQVPQQGVEEKVCDAVWQRAPHLPSQSPCKICTHARTPERCCLKYHSSYVCLLIRWLQMFLFTAGTYHVCCAHFHMHVTANSSVVTHSLTRFNCERQ